MGLCGLVFIKLLIQGLAVKGQSSEPILKVWVVFRKRLYGKCGRVIKEVVGVDYLMF